MKTILIALICAAGIGGAAQAAPSAMSESARADAMASLTRGDVQQVDHQRKRVVRSNPYSLRAIHRRGHWCGKGRWYGKRCYYTPSGLKPLRQR